jgi:hypothetical protein
MVTKADRHRRTALIRHRRSLRRALLPCFNIEQELRNPHNVLGAYLSNHSLRLAARLTLRPLIVARASELYRYAAPEPMHITVYYGKAVIVLALCDFYQVFTHTFISPISICYSQNRLKHEDYYFNLRAFRLICSFTSHHFKLQTR